MLFGSGKANAKTAGWGFDSWKRSGKSGFRSVGCGPSERFRRIKKRPNPGSGADVFKRNRDVFYL
ncbi:hypothetical protein CH375_06210 [Leptospira ellisii]|uniref:Uncharacterized protein n=1 Tax=Leptospira ellisii TaxID=2023197 RepID=A0A2N0B775_9LEPT|nr:hypothetical protein CH379_13330 [Leptospira ellisii]PKA05252.1 hypothetical protein CH375_06210 [Leptospira ellisii]